MKLESQIRDVFRSLPGDHQRGSHPTATATAASREVAARTNHGGVDPAERGSALVIALLVMVIMTILGLSFLLVGQVESRIARNERDSTQALFLAEGSVRMVKKWFDIPTGTGAYIVPTTAQMDRTLRYVDDDGDGTYTPYASAPSPWNVTYRQSTSDPFEKPYRGTPEQAFLGPEDHPDLRISETGSAGEKAFLTSLNNTLYPNFPAANQRARVKQIDVYSPPIIVVSGSRVRYGIATVKVTAGLYQNAGTAQETQIATRVVKAILNEAPYPGPVGPLQSCVFIGANGNFAPHWGKVTAVTTMDLANNLDGKVDSSIPFFSRDRYIVRDNNYDGTVTVGVVNDDDKNGDGTADFDQWQAAAGNVEDPWLRFWSQGTITAGGNIADCGTADCSPTGSTRPYAWLPNPFAAPGMSNNHGGNYDHSNMWMHVTSDLCPQFDYSMWKQVSLSGTGNVFYYASDGAGTGTYKLFGSGSSVNMVTATNGKNGLFFFDTATNSVPVDTAADGTFDNLADTIQISGGSYQAGGFIYLNASFATTGNGSVATQRKLIAPAEPYVDLNGNGKYDSNEPFIDVTYPGSRTGTYAINGQTSVAAGGTYQDPSKDVGTAGKWDADINMYGVIYSNGTYDAQGNWIYFGSVITHEGMIGNGASGTPDIYFDERLIKGNWPPPELNLPRTIISSWQTEL